MPQAFQSYKPPPYKVYGSICVNDQGKILLVRGRESQKWSFPKGHLERGERAEGCARRELWEETGLQIQGDYTSFHKLFGGEYFVFPIEGEPYVEPIDTHEIQEAKWIPMNEITEESFRCNIDLSIFRSVLRGISTDKCETYMESKEGRRRIYRMRKQLDEKQSVEVEPCA